MAEIIYTKYLNFAHQLLGVSLPILEKNLEDLTEAARSQKLDDAVMWKADREVVTEGEKKAEQAMRELVEKQFPTHTIIGEETGVTLSDDLEFAWVFDPIDGTSAMLEKVNNIAQKIASTNNQKPCFGITIALVHNDTPVVGIVHDLDNDITWAGAKGHPTTRNEETVIAPQEVATLEGARLASTVPFDQAGTPVMFRTQAQQRAFAAVQSAITGEAIAVGTIAPTTITNRNCIGFMHLLEEDGVDITWEGDLMFHDAAALVPILEGADIRISDENGQTLNFPVSNAEKEFRVVAAVPTVHKEVINYIAAANSDEHKPLSASIQTTEGRIDYAPKFSS